MKPVALVRQLGRVMVLSEVLITGAALLLALMIWFVGPYLGFGEVFPLASAAARLAFILMIALGWGVGGYLLRARRDSEDQALLAALRKQKEETDNNNAREAQALEADFNAFRDGARAALATARRASGRPFSSARYAKPWYVLLGNTGCGKSTIVAGATTTVSFAEKSQDTTPLANFYVAKEALLIELDGDYVAQSASRSALSWPRVLDYLRKLRPSQPVNGFVVAVGVDELLGDSMEAVTETARSLRRRIDEAGSRLRTRAPIYIVVTKLDLILGFEEFFETLTAEERADVLGIPLGIPLGTTGGSSAPTAADMLSKGFGRIAHSLAERLMARVQDEPDELRRRRLLEFAREFAALEARLRSVVTLLSEGRTAASRPLLRGLFFTSATQTGAFVDATAVTLARAFGQKPAAFKPQAVEPTGRSRTYFLRNFVEKVLLPEAELSGLTRPAHAMATGRRHAGNAVLGLATMMALGVWWLAFSEGWAYSARLAERTETVRTAMARATADAPALPRIEPVLALLDELDALRLERPRRLTAGLYGTRNVEEAAEAIYNNVLAAYAMPYLWSYLKNGLDDPQTPAPLRFTQLELYLALSGRGPLVPATAALLAPDFTAAWLGSGRDRDRVAGIADHLTALAVLAPEAPGADPVLIERARRHIADYSLARIAYDRLVELPGIRRLPIWRPVDQIGLSGPGALSRVGGASFWDGIEGAFTADGLKRAVLPAAGGVADALADELWIMGASAEGAARGDAVERIRDGLLDIYRVEYIQRWENLLLGLDMADGESAAEVSRAMTLLIGQPSPVQELMSAIAAQVNFSEDSASLPGVPALRQRVAETLIAPRSVVDVARAVSRHFEGFLDAVAAPEGQISEVDAMIAALAPLARKIAHVASGGDVLELGTEPQTLLAQLTTQVNGLPDSVQPLFRRILNRATAVTVGSSRERLSQIWTTTALPACRATTDGRYPFDGGSDRDASLADFANLFAPTGVIATFRNDYLRPFVDTTVRPWRWRTGMQFGLGLDEEVLRSFERADAITTLFFPEAGDPKLAFTIEPVGLDGRARAMRLDLGGTGLSYSHGPSSAAPFSWPADVPGADAILSMTPEFDGERNAVRRVGPWALFRLLDTGRIMESAATDAVRYRFEVGSRSVMLDLGAPPSRNPFRQNLLADFTCPVL